MKICYFLEKDHIFLDLKTRNKQELLKELVEQMKLRGLILNDEVVLNELLKRESICSTGLEQGIAVPHTLTEEVKKPLIAMVLIKAGMDFEAVDQKPTYVLLLLLGPKNDPGLQLRILAHICRLVKETPIVEKLKKADSAEDICNIFKQEEGKIE
ncbi:MAG: PTS sugar transporter subunit IIA [Candidatus Aminicenantes bacterium]|nr:PTS sugar transporter subunit IIA [Candidatus Aminicenantes bacterium]